MFTNAHSRLHCPPLRKFHATRLYSGKLQASVRTESPKAKVKTTPPRPSQLKDKKAIAWKRNEGKRSRNESLSTSVKLSSLLRRHDRSTQHRHAAGGGDGTRSRASLKEALLSRSLGLATPNGKLSLRGTKRASENHRVDQPISGSDIENAPHLPSSLSYSRRVDGVIQPRGNVGSILQDVIPPSPQNSIATLAHGLERVLFNPGVQWLQDPRSHVYSFTTWLEKIIPVKNFAFERLPPFLPSSRDQDLHVVAKREGRKYAGSTSSMTGLLSQLYYLISGDKPINASNLSRGFSTQPQTFTPGQRGAASVILNYRDGVYLIDNANDRVPGFSEKNVLIWMGTLLEKFLTHSPTDFLRLTRSFDAPTPLAGRSDKFVLRSQLDCVDHRLPGTGVFDIKTRAVMTIRHDLLNFEESSGYQIRTLQGLVESFEKEYYDLIRSAFLKYSFQARIGNMDGVFVAYHNTKKIFGFQYIPLSEMDARLFGDDAVGDAVFERCLTLLEEVLEEATRELPHQSIRLTAEKSEREDNLKVFLEPADWDEELHGHRPVTQLNVWTKNYISEMAANGPSAVERSNLPWTVLWSISKPAFDPCIIRGNLAAARNRALHPLILPTGVDIQDMEKVWQELQFNPTAPVDVPFNAELFRPAPRSVQVLRQLAHKGQSYLDAAAREQGGRDKFVLGLPNDAREMAPLLAQAHGDPSGPLSTPSVSGGSSSPVVNTTSLPAESQNFEGTREPDTSSAIDQEQKAARRDVVPPMMKSRTPGLAAVVDVGEQADRTFRTVSHPQGANGGSGDFVSESTVAHLEEMLSKDLVGDYQDRASAGGQMTAVSPKPAHHIRSRSRVAERKSEALQLIRDTKRNLRDADQYCSPPLQEWKGPLLSGTQSKSGNLRKSQRPQLSDVAEY
ncbi:mitochondrial protein Pet127-domain-containing protein [Lactarius akahatsu]|uniref:Mitochondrial protein Pet127-domain-containing protein n=1 Tax=Lactarius akahatsu TaxID=416441 RepID=A0AAD4LS46_9AGAM|nr:mitochondrial protein Pet127-domain-containing protein [Lactarius akahatsu]